MDTAAHIKHGKTLNVHLLSTRPCLLCALWAMSQPQTLGGGHILLHFTDGGTQSSI